MLAANERIIIGVLAVTGIFLFAGILGFFQGFPRESLALYAGVIIAWGILNISDEHETIKSLFFPLSLPVIAAALFCAFMAAGFVLMVWDAFSEGP